MVLGHGLVGGVKVVVGGLLGLVAGGEMCCGSDDLLRLGMGVVWA